MSSGESYEFIRRSVNKRFTLLLLLFSLAVVSMQFVQPSFAVFGIGHLQLQAVTNTTLSTTFVTITTTNATITKQVTSTIQQTTTQVTSTTSTSTSITTTLTSTTLTFPSIVLSTTVITTSQTQIFSFSVTTTSTQTTNALALVWESKDMSTLFWIAVFAVIVLATVAVTYLVGRTVKANGTQR